MYDRFCFLNESILLTLIDHSFDKKSVFTFKDFEQFQSQTNFMKNLNMAHIQKHPMKMF